MTSAGPDGPSTQGGPRRPGLRIAGRSPGALLWTGRANKLRAAVAVLARLPVPARRALGRAAGIGGRVLGRGRPDDPVGAPLEVIGLWAQGREDEAVARALRAADTHRPATAARAGRLLVSFRKPAAAAAVVDRELRPTDELRLARGEAYHAAGRLDEAVAQLEELLARQPGHRPATSLLDRVQRERRVLDPAWRPALGTADTPTGPRRDPIRGRVLHLLTNSLPDRPAGYTYRTVEVALAQRAAGLDPHLVTRAGFPGSEGRPGAPLEEAVGELTYHRIDPALPAGRGIDEIVERTARGAAKLVERLRPAVLQPTTNHPNAQAALALRDRHGIPVVYEVRGFIEETWAARTGPDAFASDRYRGAKAVETACMLAADAVVTLSETMAADIAARGVARDRILVVPNGVDVDRFSPRSGEAVRSELGITDDEVVLGYVSTFWSYEGIELLIEATGILRAAGLPVRALLVGDGQALPDLRAAARRLNLDGRAVTFTGRVDRDRVVDHYAAIDVFVVPRRDLPVARLVTPLKPYEAMAMAKPVVASGVDALREMLVPGETGLVFRPDDAADLAATARTLVEDAQLRRRIGEQARAWVAEHRTWRRNGERYRELFARLGAA